jgi:hypothetical protein
MVPSLRGMAPFQFAFGAAAYYETADRLGFLVEAAEAPARMPAPDLTM